MKNTQRTLSVLIALLILTSILASCTPASVLGLPLLLPLIPTEEDFSDITTTPEVTTPEENTPPENNPPSNPSAFDGIAFDDPAIVIPAAYALEKGETLEGIYTLLGQVIEAGTFNAKDNDMIVTIVVDGYEDFPIYCYYLKECNENVGVGDYVAVQGVIKNYNGKIEFERPKMLAYQDGTIAPPSLNVTPQPGTGLAEGYEVITIEQAIEIAKFVGENTTTERYYILANISSVTNAQYGSMYIEDATGSISVYGTWSEDGEISYANMTDKPSKGDQVLLACTLQTFNGTPEVQNARLIKFNKVGVDDSAYTEMNIEAARNAEEGDLVKITGVVAQITYASGMVPNGVYIVDSTNSIYVHDSDLAGAVKVGQTITILAKKTWWILDTETSYAEKFGYQGCNQLADAWLVKTSGDDLQEPDYSWVTESTIKDIINTPFTTDITTTIYKVTALVKESVGTGFINYYIDDLDGVTGSYVYTQANGNDLDWLKEFDGKICTVYISVINAKSTATGCNWRFKVLKVVDEGFTFDNADAPQFAIDYFAAEQFESKYTADPALELITSVSSEILGFENVTISYSSSNSNIIYFEEVDGKVVMHCGNFQGTVTVTITATLGDVTVTETIEIENAEAPKIDFITVADAITTPDDEIIIVKGIVGPSVVNQDTGFYLFGEDGSVIAVKLVDKTGFAGLKIGNEIILQGKRERYVKDTSKDSCFGQSTIVEAEILVNYYGNHEYSTEKFITDATIQEFYNLDKMEDHSTEVYVLTGTLYVPTSNRETVTLTDKDGNKISFYHGSPSQYSFLSEYSGQEVTLEVAPCNWNSKTYWRACAIAIRLPDGSKIVNQLNFN